MAWASDADVEGLDGPIHINGHLTAQIKENELIGPTDIPPSFQARRGTGSTIQGVEEIKRHLAKKQTGEESPSAIEDSPSTGSSSSKDTRNVVVTAATPPASGVPPSETKAQIASPAQDSCESERGRNPALSPKQGHGLPPELDLYVTIQCVFLISVSHSCLVRRSSTYPPESLSPSIRWLRSARCGGERVGSSLSCLKAEPSLASSSSPANGYCA